MPGNFLNIDTEFPTLTGKESSKELIPELMNYLSLLVEQLRYTLNNLDTTNFNSKALSDWEAESTEDVIIHVQALTGLVDQLDGNVKNLALRISALASDITSLEGRMETAEENITGLAGRMGTAEENISALGTRMTAAETGIAGLGTRLGTAESAITNHGQRIATLETWKTGAAEDLSGLRTDVNTNTAGITALRTDLTGLGSDVLTLIGEMEQLKISISVSDNGDAVFGKTGQRTDINGAVYINGVPIA